MLTMHGSQFADAKRNLERESARGNVEAKEAKIPAPKTSAR